MQYLYRDIAPQLSIVSLPDFAHPPPFQVFLQFVFAKASRPCARHYSSTSLVHWPLTFSGLVCILSLQGRQEQCPFTTRLRGLKLVEKGRNAGDAEGDVSVPTTPAPTGTTFRCFGAGSL